jgi:P4 family phage/plasmid primase-like protien
MTPRQKRALELVERGYKVVPIEAGQKRPVFAGWPNYKATPELIAEWPAKGGIGILTAATPAVDLDIRDAEVALAMQEWVCTRFGDAPARVGKAPKRLLVFAAGEAFRKLSSARFECEMGDTHQVEILGQGQQFVAYGIHPDTNKPYEWVSDQALHEIDLFDLPTLTVEQAREIIAEFERRARERGWAPKTEARETGEIDEFDFLRPKPDISDDEVRQAIELLDNPGRDYDLWLKVGAALHSHFDGSNDGLLLWHEWSERSPLYNDADTDRRYKSFGKYTGRGTTAAFLLHATKEKRAEVQCEKAKAERVDSRAKVRALTAEAKDGDTLMDSVVPEIAAAKLDSISTRTLLLEVRDRYKKITGMNLPVRLLEQRLTEAQEAQKERDQSENALEQVLLESNVARLVLDRFYAEGKHVMYFGKMWWEYRDGVWVRSEEAIVRARVQDTVDGLIRNRDEETVRIATALFESRGDRMSAMVASIFATMTSMCAREAGDDPLNLTAARVPMAMNTRNCELWFNKEGAVAVKRHNAEHCMTAQLEAKYEPSSTCPTWDAAIRKVFSSCLDPEDVIRHFEEVFGYIIQPSRHQAIWVMLKGPGGNGKSFLLQVICGLMGGRSYASTSLSKLSTANVSNHFTDSLQGKLMLLDDDLKAGTLLPDDWLKKLSEAKSLSADPKFGASYQFTARSVPVILTNKWPSTVDLTDGIRRRAMIFESTHKLTEGEKNPLHLEQILDGELPGVLNRLTAGFQRFLQRGSRFDVPYECVESQNRWLSNSNTTALFVSECLEKTGSREDFVQGQKVYDLYNLWIKDHEANSKALGRNKFYEALKDLGLVLKNHGGSLVFSGIQMRTSELTNCLF